MTPEQTDTAERERRRNEVLAACLEDPVLAAEVAAFLADHDWLARLARPLRRPSPPPLSPASGARGEAPTPRASAKEERGEELDPRASAKEERGEELDPRASAKEE
ncbi:MAG TPA: hypothetical protein VNK04_13170, partial [Gemmataceae bacterium]|nr:hypothetical protein [Gemmataceae bacterium]